MLAFVLNVKERNDNRSQARVRQVGGSEGGFYGLNATIFCGVDASGGQREDRATALMNDLRFSPATTGGPPPPTIWLL
jgi:hypothetical protein